MWLSAGDNLFEWMESRNRDRAADVLLDLDGQVFVVESKGEYVVRFSVRRVDRTPE